MSSGQWGREEGDSRTLARYGATWPSVSAPLETEMERVTLSLSTNSAYCNCTAMLFSLQVCVAVRVYSREAARSVAVELRHGAAVSRGSGPQPLQRQQGGEQDGKSAVQLHKQQQKRKQNS